MLTCRQMMAGLLAGGVVSAVAEPVNVRVSASSELPYERAALVIDGDETTFWLPAEHQENWLQLEFSKPWTIETVTLDWHPCVNADYVLSASGDGSQWTVLSEGGSQKPYDIKRLAGDIPYTSSTLEMSPATARFLRLDLKGGLHGLSEFRVNDFKMTDPSAAFLGAPVPADAPYRNPDLPAEQRAANVVSLMTDYEKHQFVSGYRRFYIRPLNRFGLREVYSMDASGGVHLRPELDKPEVGSIAYPATVALAATWNPDLARRYGNSVARECRQHGADILLGPGFNLYRTSTCGRNFEYMGEDPLLAADMAAAYILGMQSEKVLATAKHFICNNHEWMRHTSDVIVDDRALHEIYMYPWYFAVHRAEVAAVMTSYNWLGGEKVSQSPAAINRLLCEEVGFEGLIMSDWRAVIDSHQGLISGQNLIMPQVGDFKTLRCDTGAETVRHLNNMARRILTPLFRFGVYDRARKDPDYLSDEGRRECEGVALQTAREAVTLLKNDGVLPLDAAQTVLITGPGAEKTFLTGLGSGHVDGYDHTHIAPELRRLLGADKAVSKHWKTLDDESIRRAPVLVLCMQQVQGEGTDTPPVLKDDQEEFVKRCVRLNPHTVVAVNSGSGLVMDWADEAAAVVFAYYPGQYGGTAIADVLTGAVNPSGRLPFTIEKQYCDSPGYGYRPEGSSLSHKVVETNEVDRSLPPQPKIYYNEGVFAGYRGYDSRNREIRYPFGYGLSYTTFEYSDLNVEQNDEGITVRATIANTGGRAGSETVQLYVRPEDPGVPRPVRELKAFSKIELAPGEKKRVGLKLSPAGLAYYDVVQKNWFAEPGGFTIELAASSRDIRLSKKIRWTKELRYQRPCDPSAVR